MAGLPDDYPVTRQLSNIIEATLRSLEPALREYFGQLIERNVFIDDQFIMGFVHGQRHMFMYSTHPGAPLMLSMWRDFPQQMQKGDEHLAARIKELVEIIHRER